jgi:WD40 repeat protein
MPISCPQCGKQLKVPEGSQGKSIRCPGCRHVFAPPTADVPLVALAVEPVEEPPVLEALPVRPVGNGRANERADRPRYPEEKGKRERGRGWGIVATVVAIVLILCGGVGAVVFLVGKRIVDAVNNPTIPASEWRSCRPDGARCSVSMPGEPRLLPVFANFGRNGGGREFVLPLNHYKRTFHLAFSDLPPDTLKEFGNDPLNRLADAERDHLLKQPQYRQVSEEKAIVYAGIAGRDMRLDGPDMVRIERVLLVKRANGWATAYALAVEGPNLRPDSPEVALFLDSLVLDPDNPQPIPQPNPNPNPRPKPNPGPKPKPTPTPNPNQLKIFGDQLTIHPGGTRLIRHAPDGKTLAALGEDGTLTLIDVPDLIVRTRTPGIAGPFRDLAYAPDSSVLAVAAGDGMHLSDGGTGKEQKALPCPQPIAVAFSADGKKLAIAVQKAGAADGEVQFWDRDRGTRDGEALTFPGGVRDLAWSSDGKTLAIATGGEVRLFDANSRQPLRTIAAHTAPISGMAFTPDGKRLCTLAGGGVGGGRRGRPVGPVGGDSIVKLWSVADGSLVNAYEAHLNPAGRPEFSPDGSRLATFGGRGDEVVNLWDTESGRHTGIMVLTPVWPGCLSFNRDGRTLVIAGQHASMRVWNTDMSLEAMKLMRPRGQSTRPDEAVKLENVTTELRQVRFSPDGKTLTAGGREGDLVLLNVADWKLLAAKQTNRKGLSFAYSGDGSRLIAAAGGPTDARVYLRDGSGRLHGDFAAGDGQVAALALTSDSKLLAVGFETSRPSRTGLPTIDAVVRLWDITGEPKLLGTLEKLEGPLGGLAFSGDGQTLHVAAGRSVRRWRAQTREELPALPEGAEKLTSLVVAGDGRVYAGGVDGIIRAWDAGGRPVLLLEGHQQAITGLALTADGRRLASCGRERTCVLWDTTTGEKTASTTVETDRAKVQHWLSEGVRGLPAFSPDGSLLAVAADDSSVSVLRTAQIKGKPSSSQPQTQFTRGGSGRGQAASIALPRWGFYNAVGFSDNGTLLALLSNSTLQRWNWPGGTLRDEWRQDNVSTLLRSRDGKVLAVVGMAAVYVRDADTGKLRAEVRPEQLSKQTGKNKWGVISRAALAPTGDLLALVLGLSGQTELIVWDMKEGRQRASVRPEGGGVTSLDFSPDGKTLAAGLFGAHCVALYDPAELKEIKRMAQEKAGVQSVTFSPDGKKLATSDWGGVVKLWDVAEDRELWSQPLTLAHSDRQPVCFSPDGKLLAAATRGRMVLADVADGKVRAEVTRTPEPGAAAAFSPDGKFLAVVQLHTFPLVVFEIDKLLAEP